MEQLIALKTLKKLLKSKRITYGDLAEQMAMSESGIKKMFNAKDISLNRVAQIAEIAGVSMGELFQLAEAEEIKLVTLSMKQEKWLLENNTLFRIFWLVAVDDKMPEEIRKIEKISAEQLHRYFLKLDSLDLVRIDRKGRIRPIHKSAIRWSEDGPLVKKLNREWSELTLDKVLKNKSNPNFLHRLAYLKLSARSQKQLIERLNDLLTEFARLSQREKLEQRADELKPVSALIAVAESAFF